MSKSPSLRRIQADIRELAFEPSDRYVASPMENDMFEWHFTIRGPDETDFEGGIYHGRILLPPDYPFKPPHIIFLTPSGRFETNTKVCLSFSAYHPELWQPAWGIRLILEAMISFLPTPADGAIGALDWSSEERKRLAKSSQTWKCPCCGPIQTLLPKLKSKPSVAGADKSKKQSRFQKEIEHLTKMQKASHLNNDSVASKSSGASNDDAKANVDKKETGSDAVADTAPKKEGEDGYKYETPQKKDDGTQPTAEPVNTTGGIAGAAADAAVTAANTTTTPFLLDEQDEIVKGEDTNNPVSIEIPTAVKQEIDLHQGTFGTGPSTPSLKVEVGSESGTGIGTGLKSPPATPVVAATTTKAAAAATTTKQGDIQPGTGPATAAKQERARGGTVTFAPPQEEAVVPPPPQPTPTAQEQPIAPNTNANNAVANNNGIDEEEEDQAMAGSNIIDPILQAIILVLSIICYLVGKKVSALWDDLQALQALQQQGGGGGN